MADMLSVEIDLDPIISSVIARVNRYSKGRSAYTAYLTEINTTIPQIIVDGATKAVISSKVNEINRKHYQSIKEFYYTQIGGSGIDFTDIKNFDSYGMTTSKRVRTSILRSFKMSKKKMFSLKSSIDSGIAHPGRYKADFIESFVSDFANSISRSLGTDSSRLIDTETYKTKQMLSDLKNADRKCQWVLGPNENHCPVCSGYNGNVYLSPKLAPVRPVHPNCKCYLKYLK